MSRGRKYLDRSPSPLGEGWGEVCICFQDNYPRYHTISWLVQTHCRPSLRTIIILLTSSFILLPIAIGTSSLQAQILTPLSHEMNRRVEHEMMKTGTPFFTVMKPYVDTQLRGNARQDSLNLFPQNGRPNRASLPRTWLTRKLFHESFIQVDSGNYYLFFDPLFDLTAGRENNGRNTFINTRGFRAGGRLGKYFAFGTDFYENQAIFNTKLHDQFKITKVIPGQGNGRLNGNTWDFATASGYLSFSLKKFNFQFGQGKNFIGDGYRSLILSDVHYSYPYTRLSWNSQKWIYTWLLAQFQSPRLYTAYPDVLNPYPRNIFSLHLLAFKITNKFQISLTSSELFNAPDSIQKMKINGAMFNPTIIPINSNLKRIMNFGLNVKYNISDKLSFYQQYVWSHNKINFQLGLSCFDLLGIRGLYQRVEFNRLDKDANRSLLRTLQWMQFGEPIGHPAGHNIQELISLSSFSIKRWQVNNQFNFTKNFKHLNSYAPVSDPAFPYFVNDQKLYWNCTEISYFINQKTLMNLTLGCIYRKETVSNNSGNLMHFYFAFRTSLRNLYFDK